MKIGDKVEWFSSGTKKQGEIVAVVPKYDSFTRKTGMDIFRDLNLEEKGFSFKQYGGGCPRKEVSFLVSLYEPKKKAGSIKKIYWPNAKQLKFIESYTV